MLLTLRLTPNVLGLVFFQILTLFNVQQPLVLLTLLNNVHVVRQPAKNIASSLQGTLDRLVVRDDRAASTVGRWPGAGSRGPLGARAASRVAG